MATFTGYKQINMEAPGSFATGVAYIHNATHLQIRSGLYLQDYYGSFKYNASGSLASGTVTSTEFFYNAGKIYSITGGNYSILIINNYLLTSNLDGLLNYIFAGNDVINGPPLNDLLKAYSGNDTINGNGGNDTLKGGDGNDVLNGGIGSDILKGGNGSDIYYVDSALDAVIEENSVIALGGNDLVYSTISSYKLPAYVENGRINSPGPANLTGNDLNNVIYAGTGNNQIDGGAGTDTVSFGYATTTGVAGVSLNLSVVNTAGQSTATGISGTDLIKNIENISGSNYADTLVGNKANNLINGNNGNDLILGGLGNDTLNGGEGKNVFRLNTAQ